MLISVAICTFQRYQELAAAIGLLRRQTLPAKQFEILVVDNSPDPERSQREAVAHRRIKNLRWVHTAPPGLGRARNRAIAEAAAPLLAFIDDDVEVPPGWLAAIVAGFATFGETVHCVGGPVRPVWPAPRPDWLADGLLPFLSLVDRGPQARLLEPDEWVAGANLAYRRERLRAAGGFRTDLGRSGADTVLLSNEETELDRRLRAAGGLIGWLPDAGVRHRIAADRLDQRWFRRRAAWQAVSDFLVGQPTDQGAAWSEAKAYLDRMAHRPPQRALADDHATPELAHWQVSATYHLALALLGGLQEPPAEPEHAAIEPPTRRSSTAGRRKPDAGTVVVTRETATVVFTPETATVVFTIVSMNYIAYAATLMQSVRAHHPEATRLIVLADTARPYAALDLAAELMPCDALGIGLIDNMRLWYSVIELNTALKPYVFRHLLDRGHRRILYLDPDIVLHSAMTEAFALLERHSIVLTPHLLRPLTEGPLSDELEPSDHTILKAGVYNLGFLAMRDDADARRLVAWWAARCFTQCRVDVAANLFTDQRWMDLAPGFVAHAAILRHPGYNVAYWNLANRVVRRVGGEWQVDGERLVFFHFSGLRPDDPTVFSAFQTRLTAAALGEAAVLAEEFRRLVAANGWWQTSQAPYGYALFADGRPIEAPMRRWLLRAADEQRLDPLEPLEIAADFFDQADETAAARGIPMTRMMYQTWLDRPDLRLVFDVHTADGLDAYVAWFTGPDSEIEAPSMAAAVSLYDTHLRGEVDPTRSAVAQALPAPPAPWSPVAVESWAGPAAEVATWLGRDVRTGPWPEDPVIPFLAALAWERRPDLQAGFPVGTPGRLGDFLGWVLTAACAEAVIDPVLFSEDFIGQQQRPAGKAADYRDVPMTSALLLSARSRLRRDYLNGWEQFPHERRARLAHGLWFAYVAPLVFGWPDALAGPVRAYFDQPTDTECGGFRFSRGALALWELRPDLQQHFPLQEVAGRWGFLHWIVGDGLHELGLTLDAFDPRLRRFLSAPSPRLPGIATVIEMAYAARPDLQSAFDIATPEGREALLLWAYGNFDSNYAGRPVQAVRPSPPAPVAAIPVHRATVGVAGQLAAASGRAEDLRNALAAFAAVGFDDYVVFDFDSRQVRLPDGTVLPRGCRVSVATGLIYRNADTAAEDWRVLRDHHFTAARSIGCWAWELAQLPQPWLHALSFHDELWGATRFARDAFARAADTTGTGRRVSLVPMAVSLPGPTPAPRRDRFDTDAAATLFLFAFDFRSHYSRKNPEAVIDAFLAAFPAEAEVQLLIKSQGGSAAPGAWRRLNELCTDPRILLRDTVLSREEMLRLIAGCDAFVSLHRAEGFGRLPAEAMCLGRPVIATAYSGTADFVTADCAYPVGSTMVAVEPGAYPGGEGQVWAEPDIAQAADYLRLVHERPEEAAAVGARGRARIQELYDPAQVGRAMLDALGLRKGRRRKPK